jgi:hypothetical protein
MTLGIDVSRLFTDMIMVSPLVGEIISLLTILSLSALLGDRDKRYGCEENGLSLPHSLCPQTT